MERQFMLNITIQNVLLFRDSGTVKLYHYVPKYKDSLYEILIYKLSVYFGTGTVKLQHYVPKYKDSLY